MIISFHRKIKNRGFSLLEMTVVLAIVAIMTAIVLMNLPQMKGGLSIDVVAQEIAIYIRGAQVYSRATKASGQDYNSYGLHFDQGLAKFFLWADDGDIDTIKYYEDGQDLKSENYELPAGFKISKLFCSDGNPLDSLDIMFRLPDPEAYFSETACILASVCLQSANTEQWRVIETYNNGQIVVRKTETVDECVSNQ